MTDEEYVRARWEDDAIHTSSVCVCISSDELYNFCTGIHRDLAHCWSEGRQFTEAREEEIRQVEREIEWLGHYTGGSTYCGFDPSHLAQLVQLDCAPYRILAIEQARLAELRRGMRVPSETLTKEE